MQQAILSFADLVVRSPLVRWTWSGFADTRVANTLPEYRPSDIETVREMMAGRYVLASKLVDTEGLSPFAVTPGNAAWHAELHGFSWLRHFQDARDDAEKRFARTLIMDWISRNSRFEPHTWAPALTAVRVINWLRHFPLITDGATPEQTRAIRRALGTQLQALKMRGNLAAEPRDALFTAIALLGAALCDDSPDRVIDGRLQRLKVLLEAQVDEQGLHRSRNLRIQFELLTELVSVRQALGQRQRGLARQIAETVDRMHAALDALTLGHGEPGYFNGSGQLPVDLVIAVQSHSVDRTRESRVLSGYGILVAGPASLIADSGVVPPPAFSREAHAGALSFEFSHGNELIVCNCGPAPPDLAAEHALFRQGAAHSAPTIDGRSAAWVLARGRHAGCLYGPKAAGAIDVDAAESAVEMDTPAFADAFGVILRRSMTLIAHGDTLVGQDLMIPAGGHQEPHGRLTLRFHLAPGAAAERQADEAIIQIRQKSGGVWTFLWEGGTARIEDSVRQSAYFGFFRTQQIVIECDVSANREVSWIFTRQTG